MRLLSDKIVYTNVLFIIVGLIALYLGKIELFIISITISIISGLYHIHREQKYIILEQYYLHMMFLYGLIQLTNAPSHNIVILEIICILFIIVIYLGCGIFKVIDYNKYHVIQHIFGVIWLLLVIIYHKPLLI
jgi:hypothetical protein